MWYAVCGWYFFSVDFSRAHQEIAKSAADFGVSVLATCVAREKKKKKRGDFSFCCAGSRDAKGRLNFARSLGYHERSAVLQFVVR